jgi:hypothetical protein
MIAMLLLPFVTLGTTQPGAVMRVWELDRSIDALAPLVPGQPANAWFHVNDLDLDGDRGDFGPFEDDFLALVDGELLVKDAGTHSFRLTSDDGSQLWIGGRVVVDNDGLHGMESKTGDIELSPGPHAFQIKFFECHADSGLRAEWKAPHGTSFEVIGGSAMRAEWPKVREVVAGPKEVAAGFTEKHAVGPEPEGPHNSLTKEQVEEGWQLLFDGQDASTSWRGYRKTNLPEGWVAREGVLVREGGGDIVTREQFDDFDFYVDWRVEDGGNSGIFFNATEEGNAIWETAPEMQILDNAGHSNGVSALHSAGANYALHAPSVDSSRAAGKWNRVRIRVLGNHVQYWLNGVKTADYVIGSDDWKARVAGSKFTHMPMYGTKAMGHIGLQDHGDRVSFRNIRIRRLDVKPAS